MEQILWLGQPACGERGRVGGKVAHLSRLASRFPVPPGFCLTTEALSGLGDGQAVPADLRAAIAAAYGELSAQIGMTPASVAVRSSAVDEDGASASFAGQHETFLNVVGADAVVDAIVRCWQSAHSARVLEYRRRQGLNSDGVRLAVLVQALVPADVSGVAFSANPVSGARDEIVINASWGLGESIVGGTVTPDTYTFRKAGLALAGRCVAEKERMTVAVPGGTREVAVPRLLRGAPALDEARARAVARLALALDETMGWPADVEWAFQADMLYLLQCRPITTLAPAAVPARLEAAA